MRVNSKNVVASKYEVEVILEGEEWQAELDKAFDHLAKDVVVKGFRKGKAPKEMVKQYINEQKMFANAVDNAVQGNYQKALEEAKLTPIVRPTVEVKDFDDKHIEIVYTVTIAPTVELGEYKGLTVEKEKVEVSEEELNNALKSVQERNADLEMVSDRAVENGDIVNLDFTGYVEGKAFDGGSAKGYSLTIGSKSFVDGFEDQLIGMKAKEEKDILVTFPKNYIADLAGKEAKFHVKVNDIRVKVLPELNDDLALDANLPEVSTLEQLKDYLKKDILHHKEHEAEDKQFQTLIDKIVEGSKAEIADTLVEAQINYKIEGLKKNVEQNGISFDQYLQMTGTDEEKLKESMKDDAEKSVKATFVIEEITKKEDLKVTPEEMEAEVARLAEQYKVPVDEFKKQIANQIEYIFYSLKDRKFYDFIKANNNL